MNLKALRTQRHNLDFQPTNFQTQAKKQGKLRRLSRRFQVFVLSSEGLQSIVTISVSQFDFTNVFLLLPNKEGISLRSLQNEEHDPVFAHAPPSERSE